MGCSGTIEWSSGKARDLPCRLSCRLLLNGTVYLVGFAVLSEENERNSREKFNQGFSECCLHSARGEIDQSMTGEE